MKEIKIGKYNITMSKEDLTWGDRERIQGCFVGGAKIKGDKFEGFDGNAMLDAKLLLLEIAELKIKDGDNNIQFSREWAKNLTPEEGDLLYSFVDGNLSKKKV